MLSVTPWIQSALLLVLYLVWTLWCLRGSWRRQPSGTALVAYASAGGQAKALAEQLGQALSLPVLSLNQLTLPKLTKLQRLYVVASTYGEGEAPDNARLFGDQLNLLPPTALAEVEFALLALGDRRYADYCGYGLALADALQQRGARALFAPVLVDDLDAEALAHWHQALNLQGLHLQGMHSPQASLQPLTLVAKKQLNPGSLGAPLYQLDFDCEGFPCWQAGDIATLVLGHAEREYTIASLPTEGVLRLLVREQRTPSGELGLGSALLCQDLVLGASANFRLRSNPSFHAPSAPVPMILIGNGTGLAGLAAHLNAHDSGPNWLIFGERSPVADRLYDQELGTWLQQGRLSVLDLSFSRHVGPFPADSLGRCHHGYVQQVLYRQQDELKAWLKRGAVIYLCGSKTGMAQDVEQALTDILGAQTLHQLIVDERFKRDVY